MFRNRSKAVFVGAIISTVYLIYIVNYFIGINANSTDTAEAIGSGIATALVAPHMFLLGLGVLFNWLGFSGKKVGFLLTGAILYCVSAFLFLLYAVFLIPSIVLGFVGYSKQKKLNELAKTENQTKKCKKCATDIDLIAKICPQCQSKQGGIGKYIAIGAVAVFVLIVIISSSNNDNTTPVSGNNNNNTNNTNDNYQQETLNTKEVYDFKETATLDGATITVTNVEKSNGSTYDKPKSGNEFVIVTVQIKNTSDKNILYNPYDYKLQDSNGNIVSQAFTIIDSDTSLSSGELAPNGTKTGTISFEAPKGDKGLILIYEGSFWSSKQLKFNLQ